MDKYKYDVFLSYCSKDKLEVMRFYDNIKAQLRVFIDVKNIPYGAEIPEYIQNAIIDSEYFVACYSINYFSSDWAKKEIHSLLHSDPLNKKNKVIPIILQKCKVPEFYNSYKYFDFTDDFTNKSKEFIKFIKGDHENNIFGNKNHIITKKKGGIKRNLVKSEKINHHERTLTQNFMESYHPKVVRNEIIRDIIEQKFDLEGMVILDDKVNDIMNSKTTYSIIYIDIDNFTMINIIYGKKIGDEIIRKINSIKIENDIIITNWSADEFILLCVGYSIEKTLKTAKLILNRINQIDWNQVYPGLYISVSIGYAPAHKKDSSIRDLSITLERAIIGCKTSKRKGKGIISLGPSYVNGESKTEKKERIERIKYLHNYYSS